MGFFDSITGSVKGYFDKKAEERHMYEQLENEAKMERLKLFRQHYKENAFEVAKARAEKDAYEMSGLAKLRATDRSIRLSNESGPEPGTFFEKLRDYTQKNLAKRQENLERTEKMREQAKLTRDEDQQKREQTRNQRHSTRPMVGGKSTWRM